jgi:hypothetical protein
MDKYPPGLLSDAPYGVIIDGDRIIIGSPHGQPVQLSPDLQRRVQDVAKRYGAYYEGDGKDVAPLQGLLGSDAYRGSWDDNVAKSTKGYPEEFLSGLFSNVEANNYPKTFSDPQSTIFDSILKNQSNARYFKDRAFDAKTLENFLRGGSQGDADFVAMSRMPATPENLQRFFGTGEKLMWPDNWQQYPNKLGKYAQKFEQARNAALTSGQPGVYVAGAGHLPEIAASNKRLRLIGGERAAD